jgi:hypothetical protein
MKTSVCVLLNLRLNDLHKVKRFLKLLELLATTQQFEFSVRIRGSFKDVAIQDSYTILTKHGANFSIYSGENVANWKLNTYQQVKESNAESFFILNEDHFPVAPAYKLSEYFDFCLNERVDVGLLVFPASYQRMYEYLSKEITSTETFYSLDLTSKYWRGIPSEAKNYPVSLVGFYKKKYLIKLLNSRRPFVRRYPFNSPFDFEQSGDKKWIFPIRIAFAKEELLGCIDEDGSQVGSSLISRGLYTEDKVYRSPNHHKEVFGEKIVVRFIEGRVRGHRFCYNFLYICQRKLFNLLRLVKYSFHGIICWDYQKILLERKGSSASKIH